LLAGVDGQFIVSRSQDEQVSLVLESVWAGTDMLDSNVDLASGEWFDTLSIKVGFA
jgi:hypothetical protein